MKNEERVMRWGERNNKGCDIEAYREKRIIRDR
jgi:hypothetical protein